MTQVSPQTIWFLKIYVYVFLFLHCLGSRIKVVFSSNFALFALILSTQRPVFLLVISLFYSPLRNYWPPSPFSPLHNSAPFLFAPAFAPISWWWWLSSVPSGECKPPDKEWPLQLFIPQSLTGSSCPAGLLSYSAVPSAALLPHRQLLSCRPT